MNSRRSPYVIIAVSIIVNYAIYNRYSQKHTNGGALTCKAKRLGDKLDDKRQGSIGQR
ncbi:hypothetical protein DY000_02025672 [Brassica cretica]|uniref:Uncharacterized protein n=1 Tax=Brassica cretica TaxID=69181 RepID=A0ABQ7E4B9_BRACR|nr:hypothetical protein DY000_02025672 [Brassica cretica]